MIQCEKYLLTLGMLQQTNKHYPSPPISYSLGRNTDKQAELQLNVLSVLLVQK